MTYIKSNEKENISKLLEEQEKMKTIIKDLLSILSKDNPELILKHMEYFKVDETHLDSLPNNIEKPSIF